MIGEARQGWGLELASSLGELEKLCHLETRQCIGYIIVSTRYMHHTHINIVLCRSKVQ